MSQTAPVIRPHPRQTSWAMAMLALLAVGSFGKGIVERTWLGDLMPWAPRAEAPAQSAPAAPPPDIVQFTAAELATPARPAAPPEAEPEPAPVVDVAAPAVEAAPVAESAPEAAAETPAATSAAPPDAPASPPAPEPPAEPPV